MRTVATLVGLLLGLLLMHDAQPAADRESLLEAWEAHVASLPGTERFEPLGDGVYQFTDTDLPYDGELTVIGALVRPTESAGYETGFSHAGMIDFRLGDLPAERLSSQVYYYWLTDRQSLHYSDVEQRWVDTATFQRSIATMYSNDESYSTLSFMLNYGIWVVLGGLLLFAFLVLGRQAKKARALMDDSASINDKARENIERAQALQDEILAISRETRDLQADNNALLKQMLEALRK